MGFKAYEDLTNDELKLVEFGWEHLNRDKPEPKDVAGWKSFYEANLQFFAFENKRWPSTRTCEGMG